MSSAFPSKLRLSLSRGLIVAVLLGYAAWVVFPMLWVAYSSLKPDSAIFHDTFALPAANDLRFDNYVRAWQQARFGDYFLNSVLVTAVSVTLIVGLGAMAAYALARFYHPAARFVFWLFLAGLMIPAQLAIVPLFFELRHLGLLNSRLGLILVYTANGLPFAIFVLAGFFRSLPRTLYEAAVIDGCGEWTAFWRVLLPLARPGLVDGGDLPVHRYLEGVFFRVHARRRRCRRSRPHAATRARQSFDHLSIPLGLWHAVRGARACDGPDSRDLPLAATAHRQRHCSRRTERVRLLLPDENHCLSQRPCW